MSTPKKGFDPLASLFDLPETPPARPDPVYTPPPTVVGGDVPDVAELKPSAPPALPGPDPAQLAKILARAAAAKAAAGAPARALPSAGPRSVPPPPKLPVTKAAATVAPPAKGKAAGSLASRMAPPPRRVLSAEQALAAARSDEEAQRAAGAAKRTGDEQKAAAAKVIFQQARAASVVSAPAPLPPMRADQLADMLAGIVATAAPELGAVYFANAVLIDDRAAQAAIWRGHRARFATQGDLDAAVACGAVLRALTSLPMGNLAVAHAVTDKTDWLVWVDLVSGSPLAAFRDARAWFSGG